MTDRQAVYQWLRRYADCLGDVVPQLDAGEAPGPDFLDKCQVFDTQVRQFDVTVLREALGSDEGRRLTERLNQSKARFEAVMDRHQAEIEGRLRGLDRGRTTLRGYADAGDHQRMGPAYLEKAL
ncbi:MAG: hypothetical protein GY898_15500 [Proteobacteria bacterium]|nr:hypothetical protein [Pseudomonadota bacterium]